MLYNKKTGRQADIILHLVLKSHHLWMTVFRHNILMHMFYVLGHGALRSSSTSSLNSITSLPPTVPSSPVSDFEFKPPLPLRDQQQNKQHKKKSIFTGNNENSYQSMRMCTFLNNLSRMRIT